jgi:peptidoglycan/xylan/chitin deacetylase (PgdA/CDA1 family)
VYHGPRHEKVVALTFDDGWGGRALDKILRVLRRKHVNATFFPVGQAVRLHPKTWRRITAAGFPIADHTFDHRTLAGLCFPEQRLELARARQTYSKVLDVTPLPVMRPPGGLFDDATRDAASSEGEPTIVLWDVDTLDWTGIGRREIRANALTGTKGSIIVLHTSSLSTARALPGIIRGYRKRGFEFVTIGQLLGISGPVPYPATAGAD